MGWLSSGGSSSSPPYSEIARMATRPMPCLSFSAGNGNASTNIVMTGDTNDSGQLIACENHKHAAIPNASLSMRTLAMSTMRLPT